MPDSGNDWLSKTTKPYFAWVHYFDPHLPYRSPLGKDPAFAMLGTKRDTMPAKKHGNIPL